MAVDPWNPTGEPDRSWWDTIFGPPRGTPQTQDRPYGWPAEALPPGERGGLAGPDPLPGVTAAAKPTTNPNAKSDEKDPYSEAEIREANARAAQYEAAAAKAQFDLQQAQSPEARQEAQARIDVARAQIRQIDQAIADAKARMPDAERIALEHQLAQDREAARQQFEAEQREADRGLTREQIAAQERQAAEREAGEDRRTDIRESGATERLGISESGENTRLTAQLGARREEANQQAGIEIRGQDIQLGQARDQFFTNMLAQRIAAGQLSLDKATKMFEAYVTRAKLPTEIMANVSRAVEPFIPYLTSAKAGDIPMGFERGGPMEALYGHFGGTYDPKTYAIKPVDFDLKGAAASVGADFSQSGKVPDPSKQFGIVPDIRVDPNRRSATEGVGPAPAMLGAAPVVQMDDETRARIAANVGKR